MVPGVRLSLRFSTSTFEKVGVRVWVRTVPLGGVVVTRGFSGALGFRSCLTED